MARSSPIIQAKKERGELAAERAFRLRLAGGSFPEIANTLGITTAAAWKAFRRAMDARKVPDEQVREMRALENLRLDELQMPFVQRARQA